MKKYQKGDVIWEIQGQGEDVIEILLKNRGIKKSAREEFFKPSDPVEIKTQEFGLVAGQIKKALQRIQKAQENGEKIFVWGDYDADGICATAILWEVLHSLGFNCLPFIPDRFEEGYGLNKESLTALKTKYPDLSLIITVDNGIMAGQEIEFGRELGIDFIITDHHEAGQVLPKGRALIHSTTVCGSALAWVLAREIRKLYSDSNLHTGLDLVAVGTVADQMPLLGINRSLVKSGLDLLNKTQRPGLLSLFSEAGTEAGKIGTYEVGFIIAPRLNAMGRLSQAMESLRLLCTPKKSRAEELAQLVGQTNAERQKIVKEMVTHAKEQIDQDQDHKIIILSHKTYHEGVIGLLAAKIVEEHYRPAIVFSVGEQYAKASARSIPGLNIIETIRELGDIVVVGGGHQMAAGFTVETQRLEEFNQKMTALVATKLNTDLLARKLSVDIELSFTKINWQLADALVAFAPFGLANPVPVFVSYQVEVLETRWVGRDRRHLKLKLRQEGKVFDAIAFGFSEIGLELKSGMKIDIVYNLEVNLWQGIKNIELKLKDVKIA